MSNVYIDRQHASVNQDFCTHFCETSSCLFSLLKIQHTRKEEPKPEDHRDSFDLDQYKIKILNTLAMHNTTWYLNHMQF